MLLPRRAGQKSALSFLFRIETGIHGPTLVEGGCWVDLLLNKGLGSGRRLRELFPIKVHHWTSRATNRSASIQRLWTLAVDLP